MSFTQRFSFLLADRNVTAYRLSKDTGISDSMLARWKSGERLPSLESAIALADYFNVSIDYLVGRDDTPNRKEHLHV